MKVGKNKHFENQRPQKGHPQKGQKGSTFSILCKMLLSIFFVSSLAYISFARNSVWTDEISLWKDVVAINPENNRAFANLGIALMKRNMIREALEATQRSLAIAPDPIAYNSLGHIYRKLGRYDKAIEQYSQAIAMDPGFAKFYISRGNAYYDLGRYDLAIENYSQAILLQPQYAVPYMNRGNAYDEMGLYTNALEDYTLAISNDLSYADAYYNRGVTLAKLKRNADARSDFEKACSLGIDEACGKIENE